MQEKTILWYITGLFTIDFNIVNEKEKEELVKKGTHSEDVNEIAKRLLNWYKELKV